MWNSSGPSQDEPLNLTLAGGRTELVTMTRGPPPPAHQAAPHLPHSFRVSPAASTSGLQTNPVLSMLQQRIRHDTELLNRIMSQQNENDISGMSSPHFQEDLSRWTSPSSPENLSRLTSPHSLEDHRRWMSPHSQEDLSKLMPPHSQEDHGRLMSPHPQEDLGWLTSPHSQEDLGRLTSPHSQAQEDLSRILPPSQERLSRLTSPHSQEELPLTQPASFSSRQEPTYSYRARIRDGRFISDSEGNLLITNTGHQERSGEEEREDKREVETDILDLSVESKDSGRVRGLTSNQLVTDTLKTISLKQDRPVFWNLLSALLENNAHSSIIRWTNPENSIFKILNFPILAEVWGVIKSNRNMTVGSIMKVIQKQ